MRIVGGKHKGTRLASPSSQDVRPTSDRIREALFNILTHGLEDFELEGARVLDLFAGTGALGLEALSRGARFALFIDNGTESRGLIRRNIETLRLTGSSKVWRRDATQLGVAGTQGHFDLVFADPPYGRGLGEKALEAAVSGGWLASDAVVVLEENAEAEIAGVSGLMVHDTRIYGDTQLVIQRDIRDV